MKLTSCVGLSFPPTACLLPCCTSLLLRQKHLPKLGKDWKSHGFAAGGLNGCLSDQSWWLGEEQQEVQEVCSLPPRDAPAREKELEGEHWGPTPPSPAAQPSQALVALDKWDAEYHMLWGVVGVWGEQRKGRMMEDDSGGTRPDLWCPFQRLRCSLDQPFAQCVLASFSGCLQSSQLSEDTRWLPLMCSCYLKGKAGCLNRNEGINTWYSFWQVSQEHEWDDLPISRH